MTFADLRPKVAQPIPGFLKFSYPPKTSVTYKFFDVIRDLINETLTWKGLMFLASHPCLVVIWLLIQNLYSIPFVFD